MKTLSSTALRAAVFLAAGIGIAPFAAAIRAGGSAAPASAPVQAVAAPETRPQVDETASLRQGTIVAIDERGARLQVQGIWLDVVAGKTVVMRAGRPAAFDTLRAGETIRFTAAPGESGGLVLRVVYVP